MKKIPIYFRLCCFCIINALRQSCLARIFKRLFGFPDHKAVSKNYRVSSKSSRLTSKGLYLCSELHLSLNTLFFPQTQEVLSPVIGSTLAQLRLN